MPPEFLLKFRLPVIILLSGIAVVSIGILFYKTQGLLPKTKVEILESTQSGAVNSSEIIVEIAGEVESPGVYKLPSGSRVDELITIANGFTKDMDATWVNKYLNRANKLTDGQKIYIPKNGEQTSNVSANKNEIDQSTSAAVLGQNTSFTNINTATSAQLDKLPGIGPTYAQKIIEQRPYSNIEELLSKKVLPKSTYEKIKNSISIY